MIKPDLSKFTTLDVPTRILMGPGPSMVHPRVLKAMATPLIGHLDPAFIELMNQTQTLLRYVFQTGNKATIPVSGTGSAAMEASIANLVEPKDKVLICINGYFGLRLQDMVSRYGGEIKTITRPWGEVFTSEEISAALTDFPARIVAIVHAETSTGALQPLDKISQVVHDAGALLIVDTVTSLGGVPVLVDEWQIDACYSGGQKCLSVPPGISPITFSEAALEKINNRKNQVPNWYLDMSMLTRYWGNDRTYHHTAPISANYALYEALILIAEEGLEQRWQRHRDNAEYFWNELESMGLSLHVAYENRLPQLSTLCVPDGVDDVAVRQNLLKYYNLEISGGLGELKGKVWRIGIMGYTSRLENVELLLAGLKRFL